MTVVTGTLKPGWGCAGAVVMLTMPWNSREKSHGLRSSEPLLVTLPSRDSCSGNFACWFCHRNVQCGNVLSRSTPAAGWTGGMSGNSVWSNFIQKVIAKHMLSQIM